MSVLPKLYGHSLQVESLKKAMDGQRFPHAWIFSGPKGIGKNLAALHCAHHIFSQNDAPEAIAQKMQVGAYPDFLVVAPSLNDKGEQKANITAEEIRRINDFVQQTTLAQKWRVILIDGADLMNRHASNALLKVLEDPPKYTIFFLVTHNKGELLQTIISRCQILHFKPVSLQDFRNILDVDDVTAADLYQIIGGVPGEAKDMLDPELGDLIGGLQRRLDKVSSETDLADLYKTMKGFSSSAMHINVLKKIVLQWAHSIVLEQSGSHLMQHYVTSYEALRNLFDQEKRFSLDRAQTISCIYFELKTFLTISKVN